MNLNIFKKKHHYIGLHINNHALKAFQFDISSKQAAIQGFSNIVMPNGLISNDEFTDANALSNLITRSLQKPTHGKFTTNRVIIAVPESKSFVRIIPMQAMTDSEIANAILFEAESYIPLPIDQVYFDWQVISRKPDGLEVLVIASPKVFVDKYIQIVEKAGLVIGGIETESQSVARALVPPDSASAATLIVEMDAFKTALIMVGGGTLQFTSSVPIAGNNFTESLAKLASLTLPQAEKLKRDFGFTNTTDYPNLKQQMLPAMEGLAAEIKNILKFHYDHHENHIDSLFLTGGGAKLKNMSETLESMLSEYAPIKVTVANPLSHVSNFIDKSLDTYEALSFTTAIGLAMWEIT